ncbi:chemotaxis protein CheW [Thiogranum longum]|jgi:purine-binding chemotaxis protein CheW
MKADLQKFKLLDQQLALSAYLDALFHDEALLAAPVPEEHRSLVADGTVQPLPEEIADDPQAATAAAAGGVPDWAQSPFQALLFEVAGLTLAVPLIKLKGVVPNEQGITPMPGHSPLFLGVIPYQGLQSKVVDTARFVLPADRAAELDAGAGDRSANLVMIDEGRWALACNRIGEVIDLRAADVKWRTATGRRLWLSGTVVEQMCALLDIDELIRLLADGMA